MDKWIDAEVSPGSGYGLMVIVCGGMTMSMDRDDALLLIEKMQGCIGQMTVDVADPPEIAYWGGLAKKREVAE